MVRRKEDDNRFKLDLKNFDYHSSRFFALLFPVLYLVAMSIFCVEYKIIPGPEFLVLGILIYAAYNQRTWRVVKDWLPFVTVFISYEIMYSVVGFIADDLHSGPLNFDLRLFGEFLAWFYSRLLGRRFWIIWGPFSMAYIFLYQHFLPLLFGKKVLRTTGNISCLSAY